LRKVVGKAGYTLTAENASHTPTKNLAMWRKTEQLIAIEMKDWQLPISVYVGTEMIGRLVVQMCKQRGWRVPADVAIIAGRNEETLCAQPRPSLTSIEIGYERIGYAAAELLDRLAAGIDPVDSRSLAAAPPALARRAVRRWLVTACFDGRPPDAATVERVLAVARNEHRACDLIGGWRVERHRGKLLIIAPEP